MQKIVEALAKPGHGGVILFLGAGFSRGAKNQEGHSVPTAKEFAKALADEVGEHPDTPLTIMSEIYQTAKADKQALLKLVKSTFSTREITKSHDVILRYPWKRIYTTNYDDVAEHVPAPNGTVPTSYTRHNTPLEFEDGRRQVIHLNGFVGDIRSGSDINDLGLTLASYIDSNLYSSPWATVFRQDLLLASSIIFIGYSMYDSDVSHIVGKNPAIKDKTIVIQHDAIGKADSIFLSRFGTVYPIGVEEFASTVAGVIASGISTKSLSGPENFQEIILPEKPLSRKVTDNDIESLLIRGIYDRNLFWSSRLLDSRPYVATRSAALEVVRSLQDEGGVCLVHSHLGNGKSFVIEQAIFDLLQKGFRVFSLSRISDKFSADVEFFRALKNYVLIVEEMIDNDDVVSVVTSQLGRARLLVSARTSAMEVKVEDVFHLTKTTLQEVDANKLSSSDIDPLISYLNSGAYWSHIDNVGDMGAKRRHILNLCKSEFQSISLGIVKSIAQDEKIRAFFKRPLGLPHDSIVLAMVLSYLEMRPAFDLMSELLGKDMFSLKESIADNYVAEFFAIDGNSLGARSPILAEYILHNFVSDEALLQICTGALQNSSDRHRRAERYRTFNSKIMQFSNISRILSNTPNKSEKIRDYYDRVGEIGYKDFSPYYWLQYAIASSANHDYESADRFYREAMKILERRSDFYRYKIENSFAIFLLDSRSRTDIWDDFADAFLDASRLSKVHTGIREAGNHPFKVVERFYEYLQRRAGFLKKTDKDRILEELDSWIIRLDSLPKHTKGVSKRIPKAKESVLDSRLLILKSMKHVH